MKIEELISALSNAVSQAHRATAENSMKEFFETHFERNTDHSESPAYAPKTIEIAIPNGKGSDGHEKKYALRQQRWYPIIILCSTKLR